MKLKTILFSLVRHALSSLGAVAVANGYLSENGATELIAGLTALIVSVLWSLGNKVYHLDQVENALNLPQFSTLEDLENVNK
jgi:hypothetical protein